MTKISWLRERKNSLSVAKIKILFSSVPFLVFPVIVINLSSNFKAQVFDTECIDEETDQEKLQRHQNPSSTSLSSPSLCGHKGPQREEPQE